MIREHTEKINPPRALWVSFPLGRPLGNPNDAAFQSDVLKHALALLEHVSGPVLEDFPHDSAECNVNPISIACPVNFYKPAPERNSWDELFQDFHRELELMKTWYKLSCDKSKRSTAGISMLSLDEISELFCNFVEGAVRGKEFKGQNVSDLLRMAAEDLKACYFKGLSVQPGQSTDAAALNDWFWGETHAALVINEVRKKCLEYTEEDMLVVGKLLLVPRNQLYRF